MKWMFQLSKQRFHNLGQGKELDFELEVDQESLGGTLSYTDSNVNFLGNETNYTISSISNDKPDQANYFPLLQLQMIHHLSQFQHQHLFLLLVFLLLVIQ